jgi:sRNA-binding regulator protein Hfq
LILETGANDQLIFKHAISTISQSRRSTGELRHPTNPGDNPAPETPTT